MAACEVINDAFLSISPYYVVNKVERIQCRYLFVRTPTELRAKSAAPGLPAQAVPGTQTSQASAARAPASAIGTSARFTLSQSYPHGLEKFNSPILLQGDGGMPITVPLGASPSAWRAAHPEEVAPPSWTRDGLFHEADSDDEPDDPLIPLGPFETIADRVRSSPRATRGRGNESVVAIRSVRRNIQFVDFLRSIC